MDTVLKPEVNKTGKYLSIQDLEKPRVGRGPDTKSIKDRFFPKVDKNGPLHSTLKSRCWVWTAMKNDGGYGILKMRGTINTSILAHRISWMLHFGAIPQGIFILHECDRRECVNPNHLKLGDAQLNSSDILLHTGCGPNAKLTLEQVLEIVNKKKNGALHKELAVEYNVTHSCISNIITGKHWAKQLQEVADARQKTS